jgi:queuosine precursor transporter
MQLDRKLKLYLVLLSLHTTLLVANKAAGGKLFALPHGLVASATVISYMMTFVILDVVAEIYGRAASRFVINIGLVGTGLSVAFFQFAIYLPAAPGWSNQTAFASTLGGSWRIFLAGWTGYMFGQYFDLWSFFSLKRLRWASALPVRAWISMLVGQFFDTVIFITIAFAGIFPLPQAIAGQYLAKLAFATVATPLVVLFVRIGRMYTAEERNEPVRPDKHLKEAVSAQNRTSS